MVPPDVIERVKQASDIVEVISSYVPLKRAGSYYKALSPFKKEKTPSFMVNPARQTFVCYSSGNKGDVFQFLMLYENLDFPAALERLAARAGIELPRRQATPEEERGRALRGKLLQLHAEVTAYWSEKLAHDPLAESARTYLQHREIPLTWIRDYGLGYAPDAWDDLLTWAKGRGYDREIVVTAGLAVPKESGGAYDRFRGRLMFPIRNDRGDVVGFSGRVLDPNSKEAKYVNSPETPIFKKSLLLFGLDRAKRAILDADRAVLCEGQIDVLRCHASGILNVIAPLGTALTEEHCRLLKRHAAGVVLCLDGDGAGQRAARRAADLLMDEAIGGYQRALGAELGIEVVVLPPGDDPDSIILREGPEALQKLLAQPRPFFDFLLDLLEKEHPPESSGGVRRMTEEIARFLARVPNLVLLEQLKMRAAARLRVLPEVLDRELKRQGTRPVSAGSRTEKPTEPRESVEQNINVAPGLRALIGLILASPDLIPELQRRLDPQWIAGLPGAELLTKLTDLFNDDQWHDTTTLLPHLSGAEQKWISRLPIEGVEAVPREGQLADLERHCRNLGLVWLTGQIRLLGQQLGQPGLNPEAATQLLARQQEFVAQRNRLTEAATASNF